MFSQEIINYMEELFPRSLACDWDNVGLLLGDGKHQVNKILLALDLTDGVVDEAINIGANMIITHHPILIEGIKRITDSAVAKRVTKLIRHNICLFAAHTNLDIADHGTNDTLCKLFSLEQIEPLKEFEYGKVGMLAKSVDLKDFANFVKTTLSLETIRFYGDKNRIVKRIGVCSGGGSNSVYFQYAKDKACDVYLTGDIKHHDALCAIDLGLCLIDMTHYASEIIFMKPVRDLLTKKFKALDVCLSVTKYDFHIT